MSNGGILTFERYGSTTPEENELKTLDIVVIPEPNHSHHLSHHSNHFPHHSNYFPHSNHIPPLLALHNITTTTTSTATTIPCDCDVKSRRSQTGSGVLTPCSHTNTIVATPPLNNRARNAWKMLANCCGRLKERCQQPHNNSFLSVCGRVFLIVINLLFLVSGWVMFGLGVWLHVYRESFLYSALFRDNPTGPVVVAERLSILLIGLGGFVVTVCFLGCCGACTDSVCFLAFYAFLLLIAILLQILFAALAPTFRQQILSSLAASMQYQVQQQYNWTGQPENDTNSPTFLLTAAWDSLQIELNCCGSRGPIDYQYSSWFNHTNYSGGTFVPPSCCTLLNKNPHYPIYKNEDQCHINAIKAIMDYPNQTGIGDNIGLNLKGCHSAISEWFQQHEYIIGILFLIISFQIVNIVYAYVLMSWVRKSLVDYAWCDDEEF